MSEIREVYLSKEGHLILEKDTLEALHLQDNKVQCIIDSNQIILRKPISIVKQLFACWGEESKEDYDFHLELERVGGLDYASK
jgi:hypothetical protein